MNRRAPAVVALALAAACGSLVSARKASEDAMVTRLGASAADYVPDLRSLVTQSSSELRDTVELYITDRAALLRRYSVERSPERRTLLKDFYTAWRSRLESVDFDTLGQSGRIDYLLLKNRLGYELELLAREEKLTTETAPLVPFAPTIMNLHEARRRMESMNAPAAAATLDRLRDEIEDTRKAIEAGLDVEGVVTSNRDLKAEPAPGNGNGQPTKARPAPADREKRPAVAKTAAGRQSDTGAQSIRPTKIVAFRGARIVADLKAILEQWFKYYAGYDPLFTWWATAPYKKVDESLKAYAKVLREKVVGIKEGEDEPIIGDPIGRDAVKADLAYEMIFYSPEELIKIAEQDYAWSEQEMKKASREMGFGDDWKAALERIKSAHVDPGRQPDLIRDLAREAIEFVERRGLVTVPPLARDIWRIEMLTPERQKESPFFLGGEVIQVSFPTDTMEHEDKLMSMRGNNIHFSRATVFHELIPGHHLQGFMTDRYNTHRRAFATPFWGEGWALYWEMLMWDLGFPQSPENRVGMLFWRMHRSARIIFSLGFHLGTMTPQQAVDFLVDRVGHERANATAEVRRSFNGSYSPLYQAAYMLGALQFRALRRELVDSGQMTNREFHDTVLKGGRMPVDMVRAMLTNQPLARDYKPTWKFADEQARVAERQGH